MIEISFNGLTELRADLKALPENVERDVIFRMSQVAYDEAQRGAGRHIKSGALFSSLYNRAIAGGRSVGHDGGRAPHAKFVIFGTRPHVIRPSKRKALRWVGPRGFVFAKKVNHPGYRGDDYMTRARDSALDSFPMISAEALRKAL
jgi:hypothetical protein